MSEEKFAKESLDWDSGKLGTSHEYVKKASAEIEAEIDKSLNLQMISVRLPHSLIEDLKFIAKANSIGYQPLIRDVLIRFARGEKHRLMMEIIEQKKLEMEMKAQDKPVYEYGEEPEYKKVKTA